jgi:hypothetical protein
MDDPADEPIVFEALATFGAFQTGGRLFEESRGKIDVMLKAVSGARGTVMITVPRETWQERYPIGRRFTLAPVAATDETP